MWELWTKLSNSQQYFAILLIPFFLFIADLVIKNGFKISLSTAGCDLCLAALGLDLSQIIVIISNITKNADFAILMVVLTGLHMLIWISSLRFASIAGHFRYGIVFVGLSYFFGLLVFSSSLLTIFQYLTL